MAKNEENNGKRVYKNFKQINIHTIYIYIKTE